MKKSYYIWLSAVIVVVLLSGTMISNPDFVCQTGQRMGILNADNNCAGENSNTAAVTAIASHQSNVKECPYATSSCCGSESKAVHVAKKMGKCPYKDSEQAFAKKQTSEKDRSTVLTSME